MNLSRKRLSLPSWIFKTITCLHCFLILALIPGIAVGATAPAGLDKDRLPATGRQSTVLSVSDFGRYAVTVKSPQGTALQLVDRMAANVFGEY